jgi:hypothetical protein
LTCQVSRASYGGLMVRGMGILLLCGVVDGGEGKATVDPSEMRVLGNAGPRFAVSLELPRSFVEGHLVPDASKGAGGFS